MLTIAIPAAQAENESSHPDDPAQTDYEPDDADVVGGAGTDRGNPGHPLQQVLAELGTDRNHFPDRIPGELLVSISFFPCGLSGRPAVDSRRNSISYYSRDESGQNLLTFVRIIPRNPKSGAPSLQYIGTGAITKRGTDVIDSPDAALTVLAESTDVTARQKAIEVLVASKGPTTIPALKLALSDPSRRSGWPRSRHLPASALARCCRRS
jgi:hypothetical protein